MPKFSFININSIKRYPRWHFSIIQTWCIYITLLYSEYRLSSIMRRNLLTCSLGSSMVRILWISLRFSSSALRLFSNLRFSAKLSFLSSWRLFSALLSRRRSSFLLEFCRLTLEPAGCFLAAGDRPEEADLKLLLPVLLVFWFCRPVSEIKWITLCILPFKIHKKMNKCSA